MNHQVNKELHKLKKLYVKGKIDRNIFHFAKKEIENYWMMTGQALDADRAIKESKVVHEPTLLL